MKKIKIEEINSIAKDMKYEALYWALGFEEKEKGVFVKSYDNQFIKETLEIHLNDQFAISSSVKLAGDRLPLTSHMSFVLLECLDKLLSMSFPPEDIKVEPAAGKIHWRDITITCFEWSCMPKEAKTVDFLKETAYRIH